MQHLQNYNRLLHLKPQIVVQMVCGPTGPAGPNFDLSCSLDTVNTTVGYRWFINDFKCIWIPQSNRWRWWDNAQPSDFTSFLDSGGSFYLGGNSSGMSGATSGDFALKQYR